MTKRPIHFPEISHRLSELAFPPVDAVVAILRGGRVPGFLVADRLGGLPVVLLEVRHREDDNRPRPEGAVAGRLVGEGQLAPGAHLLLVDDVSVTGRTFATAKARFPDHPITTFALKGRADLVAFPEMDGCVHWPWNPD